MTTVVLHALQYLMLAGMLPTGAEPPASLPLLPRSDHGDTPLQGGVARPDANLTDLHAFVRGSELVLAVCTNQAIPPGVTQYLFPSDLTLRIHIDNDSEVSFNDPTANALYGGTIPDPAQIHQDITFRITFHGSGQPALHTSGLPGGSQGIQLFAGLRDDPFIRGPRIGRNVAAVVITLPLSRILNGQSTLLLWATSDVPGISGPFCDLAGRSLRSMFPEGAVMNTLTPAQQFKKWGLIPDVMIYDTSRPAAFPNGRELADDVVDIVGDPRVLMNDFPFPSANDVPFLSVFPYLAPPHP
jgi:hypothetical protein